MRALFPLSLALALATHLSAEPDKEGKKRQALDKFFFENTLWTHSLAEIKAAYDPPPGKEDKDSTQAELNEELRSKLREQGIDIVIGPDEEEGAFAWLSSQEKGIRAPGGKFTLGGQPVGEVVLRSGDDGTPTEVSVMIYNRGDDGLLRLSLWEERLKEWKALLDEKLGVRPTERDQRGATQVEGWMWRKDNAAWLLEGSMTRRENRAEFIRLRLAPLNASGGTDPAKVARRSSLDENVVKKENGDVFIEGIPMVDQGDKGYCVVASVERIVRYYGADFSQNDLAGLANTDEGGTSVTDMENAFKKVTGVIHVRTLKHLDYDDRQFEKDFKSYNRIAKREGAWYDDRDFDDWWLDPRYLWMKADKDIFRKMKMDQAQFGLFNRKIKEFVDQGIPLAWTLYLGMFKEGEMPQSYGGHMRLIIGYNEKTNEIIYTDSWGKGHEFKRMDSGNAWSMTTGLYSMIPNR